MMQGTAPFLATVTVVVLAIIVLMEYRWGWQTWPMTLALSLLLGGAIGNFIDRIRFGYVVDFVDIGAGGWRWYIFNVADMSVTGFFVLAITIWVVAPHLIPSGDGGAAGEGTRGGAGEPAGR
jgi:lipoprotein signal peptidase